MMRSRGRTRTPNITTDQQERRNISPQAHKVHANITNVASDNTQIQHGSHKFVIRDTIKVHPGLCLDGTQEIEPMTTWMRGHSHDQLRQPAVMLSTNNWSIGNDRCVLDYIGYHYRVAVELLDAARGMPWFIRVASICDTKYLRRNSTQFLRGSKWFRPTLTAVFPAHISRNSHMTGLVNQCVIAVASSMEFWEIIRLFKPSCAHLNIEEIATQPLLVIPGFSLSLRRFIVKKWRPNPREKRLEDAHWRI